MKPIITITMILIAFSLSLLKADDLTLMKDKDNVVSSRLSGSWVVDGDLNLKLTGKKAIGGGENSMKKVTFESDDTVFARLPEEYRGRLEEQKTTVFMSGWMTFGKNRCPFFLLQLKGNPHVLFFLREGEEVFGNGESFNVMLAVAADTKNDLLFIGGDFNNQPFSAYHRVVEGK